MSRKTDPTGSEGAVGFLDTPGVRGGGYPHSQKAYIYLPWKRGSESGFRRTVVPEKKIEVDFYFLFSFLFLLTLSILLYFR